MFEVLTKMPKPTDLLQGTLDLLILKTIAREPLHGWGIAKKIESLSDDVLMVQQGSLYPALHRLEQQGWVDSDWKNTDLGRSAKFYSLTRDGKKLYVANGRSNSVSVIDIATRKVSKEIPVGEMPWGVAIP